jgi:hypothetical protein
MRGQTELPAIGVALLVLTATAVLGVGIAQNAFSAADRSPVERQTAVGVSDRLVDDGSGLTVRQNVIDEARLEQLDGQKLREQYGLPAGANAQILLDGAVIASTGEVSGGARIERIVLLEQRSVRTINPELQPTRTVTLPRRTDRATLTLSPPENTTVTTVWANDRVLLASQDGLAGEHELSLSPFETTELRFEAVGPLTSDHAVIEFYPSETRKAVLEVVVDG